MAKKKMVVVMVAVGKGRGQDHSKSTTEALAQVYCLDGTGLPADLFM
jgi:hypothetical protein